MEKAAADPTPETNKNIMQFVDNWVSKCPEN